MVYLPTESPVQVLTEPAYNNLLIATEALLLSQTTKPGWFNLPYMDHVTVDKDLLLLQTKMHFITCMLYKKHPLGHHYPCTAYIAICWTMSLLCHSCTSYQWTRDSILLHCICFYVFMRFNKRILIGWLGERADRPRSSRCFICNDSCSNCATDVRCWSANLLIAASVFSCCCSRNFRSCHITTSTSIYQYILLALTTITKIIHEITDTWGANWPGDRIQTCSLYSFHLANWKSEKFMQYT